MKVVKYQDDLETGRRSRKSHMTISEQVAHYRKKLLNKVLTLLAMCLSLYWFLLLLLLFVLFVLPWYNCHGWAGLENQFPSLCCLWGGWIGKVLHPQCCCFTEEMLPLWLVDVVHWLYWNACVCVYVYFCRDCIWVMDTVINIADDIIMRAKYCGWS